MDLIIISGRESSSSVNLAIPNSRDCQVYFRIVFFRLVKNSSFPFWVMSLCINERLFCLLKNLSTFIASPFEGDISKERTKLQGIPLAVYFEDSTGLLCSSNRLRTSLV